MANLLTFSPRVKNFVDAADVGGNIKNNPQILQYLNQIDNACVKAGITSGAVYPMVGANATSHKYNFLDPRDLDEAFRLTFEGSGWLHSSTGAKPNGTTSYARTYLIPTTHLLLNSTHISFYTDESISSQGVNIGARNSNTQTFSLTASSNNTAMTLDMYNITEGQGRIGSLRGTSKGFIMANRTASNIYQAVFDSKITRVTTSGGSLPNQEVYIAALNLMGTINLPSPHRICFASIGLGVNEFKAAAFGHDIYVAQRSIGR